MTKGTIIFLNGTSSSGKSSIARALQQIFCEPYLHISVDTFLDMLPEKYLTGKAQENLPTVIPHLLSGMHRCIAALASAGNNVIIDHVLQEKEWLKECVELLSDFPVLFVGVQCPLKELERREKERKREPGTARWQFDRVHMYSIYDVEVDTSITSPTECAQKIKDALKGKSISHAFNKMKEVFASEGRSM